MLSREKIARLTLVLLLCLATAVTVSVTAYLCAWLRFRKDYERTEQHVRTREDLERLRSAIETYKKTKGVFPEKLADLSVAKEKKVRVDTDGEPVDGWDHRFDYRIQAGAFVLFSLGPERLPGGVGKNADMYAGKPDTWP